MKKSERIAEFSKDLYDRLNDMLVGYGAGEASLDKQAIHFLNLSIANFILDLETTEE